MTHHGEALDELVARADALGQAADALAYALRYLDGTCISRMVPARNEKLRPRDERDWPICQAGW